MRRITRILAIMACVTAAWTASAQQDAQYTNFLFNAFGINPANAGMNKCLDARVGYRTQWVGFENNPKTVLVNAHQRIQSISRERGVVHGVGINIEGDNTGFTGRTSFHGAYAIHLPLSRKTRISFGVGIGVLQYRFDASSAFVPTAGDPLLQVSENELVFPDIKAGIWLYGKSWFAGFSGAHLTNPTLENIGYDVQLQPHFNFMAGKIIPGAEKMSYIPAAQLKFTGNSTPSLDVNFWADYDNRVALGLGFRSEDAVSGMLKFNFLEYFTLTYAYDLTYSRMRLGSSNSHEIMLGISACPRTEKPGFVPCNAYN
ncbi:MAG TPA: type IX secretion system membrane protein PorP/SprF [Cryomorphaceae bacterium]|nr:type IX secretion system membrane protein PorP/SprF [Cryomorphaceae bacterium]